MKIVPDISALERTQTKQHEERLAPAEFHLLGQLKKTRGHTLFSYNTKTGEWKVAPVRREVVVGTDGKPIYKTDIVIEKDCIYYQALNLKNAQKKWANETIRRWKKTN